MKSCVNVAKRPGCRAASMVTLLQKGCWFDSSCPPGCVNLSSASASGPGNAGIAIDSVRALFPYLTHFSRGQADTCSVPDKWKSQQRKSVAWPISNLVVKLYDVDTLVKHISNSLLTSCH